MKAEKKESLVDTALDLRLTGNGSMPGRSAFT